ncbi:Protein CBG19797 [Caenorhabditis briggsae]|uniref:YEATS domain-containing protein n=2 Tax=Caenorhabditis briggsae TaxID=6238 RepID=A0AAE9J1I6_CAEBR|nr:Protein CBG19797 [Caenorhabditis briggsae]ULU14393.1 hypothetical protein L3Y34_016715 [Caenorhabditis briggsae]CAP36923.2 Protein CBG19797 [Caenorhabditis briggsae]
MSNKIVEVIVGHSFTLLPPGRDDQHTHRWTIFVKPANKDYDDFPDTKLIQKVKFDIHKTFAQPTRWVHKPPFQITETGFASFSAVVTIHLNIPNEKPRAIPYELTLYTGQSGENEVVQKLPVMTDHIRPEYLELIKKYRPKKRKASMAYGSSNDEKSPHSKRALSPIKEEKERKKRPRIEEREDRKEDRRDDRKNDRKEDRKEDRKDDRKKEKEKKHHRDSRERSRDRSKESRETETRETKDSRDKGLKEKDKELKEKEPKEKDPKESPEELTKKLNECEDPRVIYKAGLYLLEHLPDVQLDLKTQKLSYDLTKGSADDLMEIARILRKSK